MKTAAVALLLLLAPAASTARLEAGLWEVRNTPGVATLNGRRLGDLPLAPIRAQQICLSDADAASPARFLARDLGSNCTVSRADAAKGRLRVEGRCSAADEGMHGRFEISGAYGPRTYDVRFATTADRDIGRTTFSGRMQGKRVGACAKP